MNPYNPLNPISTPGCAFGALVIGGVGVWAGYMWGKKAAAAPAATAAITVPATTTTK